LRAPAPGRRHRTCAPRSFRGYWLKASLATVLDRKHVNVAATKLDEWISLASRSHPFGASLERSANTPQRLDLDATILYCSRWLRISVGAGHRSWSVRLLGSYRPADLGLDQVEIDGDITAAAQ